MITVDCSFVFGWVGGVQVDSGICRCGFPVNVGGLKFSLPRP
jgi:hypothetical protein